MNQMIAPKRYFITVFIFVLAFSLSAQTSVLLENNDVLTPIGKLTYVLEDANSELDIYGVLNEKSQKKFEPYHQEYINFSSTASTYWLKFNVIKADKGNFYLNVGSAYIDEITLYEFDSNNVLISERKTGDNLPFSTREIGVGSYLFHLDLDKNDIRTYYLSVKSEQPLFFPLKVGTLPRFMCYIHDVDFLQGIYFGVMLLIFLYNLFLYASTKERIYMYYIMYVFSMTWFMASVFGYYFEYFWPHAPVVNTFVVVSSGLTMITATLFTQKFLNTKATDLRMHRGATVFLIIGVIVCLLVVFNLKIEGLKLAQGGLLLMAIYFLILGIRFKLKGYRPAKYYLLAWGALITGICFAILESLDVIPVMNYLNAMQIGSALEVLLLSFALGDRINTYKKQKADAQAEALHVAREKQILIKGQNEILEQKVKERTKEVAKQNEELIALNKEKNMLISIVAHDLRTPLGIIKMLIQLFKMTPTELTKDQETYLEEIENSSDRLTHMIERILDMHALETKQIKMVNEVINLVGIVKHVAKYFHVSSEEKSIEIVVNIQEGQHLVEVDKTYMIQVLENLVSNAVKFSEEGSKVTLILKTEAQKTTVVVEDNGPGISENDQKKLFGKFQRLSAQPTAGEPSTGLGLSIVKKYVEAMNGEIYCESELGVGTKFIVAFNTTYKLPETL